MKSPRELLFIQGGGEDGYTADAAMVTALQQALGEGYTLRYPKMPQEEAPDFGWCSLIATEIHALPELAFVVAHSLGASLLLKYLSEHPLKIKLAGIFLLATPFWSGEESWKQGLLLAADFETRLPQEVPLFCYQCQDDEVVSLAQFDRYRKKLPWATFREIPTGGHQFENRIPEIARDIKTLSPGFANKAQ